MFYHVIILASLDERMPLVRGYTHHSDTQCNEKTFLFLKKERAIMICKKGHTNFRPLYVNIFVSFSQRKNGDLKKYKSTLKTGIQMTI